MKYTEEMKTFILENYKGISNKELRDRFNSKFQTNMDTEQIKNFKKSRRLDSGLTGRFEKGMIPANAGKKMPPEVYEKVKATMFQKGHSPNNYRPVGSERVNVDGYIEIKTESKKWRLKHNVIWEQHYGKIPKGCAVIFLDRNKTNVAIENLKLVKRSELLIMNRHNLFGESAEVTEAAVHLAKLIDTTNQAKKNRREKHSSQNGCCRYYSISWERVQDSAEREDKNVN